MNNRVYILHPPTHASAAMFPLGLAMLSSVLRKAGFDVRAVDAAAPLKKLGNEEIINDIRDYDPSFVAVSLTLDLISEKYKLINEIKKQSYPVVAGGPHVNYLPDEVLNLSDVDLIGIGEGEEVIVEIAEYFQGKKDLNSIDGIAYKKNGENIFTKKRALISDLDSLPYPDYDDFPIRNYTGSDDPASNRVFWRIMGSRGCPYRCYFCTSNQVFGSKYRFCSAKKMFDEMNYLHDKYGAPAIALEDNEPMIDKKRISDLCDLLMKSNSQLRISCRSRIDSADTELLKKMSAAGFNRISFGIESGDAETLKKIRKGYKYEDIINGFKMVSESGFPVINFNNILGFTWETRENIENTIRLNMQVPKNVEYFATVTTPIPYPGSDLYDDNYEKYGFKDWWLDPSKHEELPAAVEDRPFYMNFMAGLLSHDMKINFWHYTKEMQKIIFRAKIKIQLLYLKNKVPPYLLWIIYVLSRISAHLDSVNPKLERRIFKVFSKKFIQKLSKKFSFTTY